MEPPQWGQPGGLGPSYFLWGHWKGRGEVKAREVGVSGIPQILIKHNFSCG